jgi:hypothetical protein
MAVKPIDVTGGKSVYCFNEYQLKSAFELAESESESGDKVREAIRHLEETLTRNERASASFVVIDRLLRSAEDTE